MDRPDTKDGCCSKCGSDNMTRAEDFVHYAPCRLFNGGWYEVDAHHVSRCDGDVRFFCADCGTYHKLPEDLK